MDFFVHTKITGTFSTINQNNDVSKIVMYLFYIMCYEGTKSKDVRELGVKAARHQNSSNAMVANQQA